MPGILVLGAGVTVVDGTDETWAKIRVGGLAVEDKTDDATMLAEELNSVDGMDSIVAEQFSCSAEPFDRGRGLDDVKPLQSVISDEKVELIPKTLKNPEHLESRHFKHT
jgi:hypothetical protein